MNRSIRNIFLKVNLICLSAVTLWGATPSVLVKTAPIQNRFMSDSIVCYGQITPSVDALKTISMPRAGQLVALRVSLGERVKAGDVLFEFLTAPDATTAYLQAKNGFDYVVRELERTQFMEKNHLATASQVATMQKALDDSKAALAAQTTLQTNLHLQQVKAPYDGVVSTITSSIGDRLNIGQPILAMFKEGKLKVALGVEPEDLSKVSIGKKVEIVSVFNSAMRFSSKVEKITGMVNLQTRLIDVIVPISSRHLLLQSGMQVRGDILINEGVFPVVVKSAVLSDHQGSAIFQIKNGKALKVPINRLIDSGGLIAISGSFDPSLPVVVTGNYELRNGIAVREARR